ncbi:3-mercaptopyruvate sulfurtransferase [Paenibacillus sp. 32O-W]|uniref:sulfurtransferase n=1 Tax=Paenibacillus sp. 32O-W TaxID=1695218 RepID=UPI00071FE54B|nr:sulfurtransferase [Paenibacillus sp. 32O-W]ALS25689.1 3-mercaptopyruvate sulfurtransferase [Paenibacillus sp. 32O-W]
MNEWIDPQQLASRLRESDAPIVADCRFVLSDPAAGEAAYREGHIPGAVYLDLERTLSAPKRADGRGGRHPLPDPEALAAALGAAGIDRHTPVVAYDDQGGAMAARLVWLLRWLGHEGGTAILDGGFAAWKAAGQPVEAGAPAGAQPARTFVPEVRRDMALSMDDVRQRLGRPGVVLIDSREAPRYRGEMEPIDPKAGHIPGAVNRFWKDGLDESGRWLPPERQRERFADLADADEIVVYCGSGVTACPNVLALEAAGFRNVRLYAGSWSDWVSDPDNPIATGEE